MLSKEERSRILNREIAALPPGVYKYVVVDRTETTAHLHRELRKPLQMVSAFFFVITLGTSLLIDIPLRIVVRILKGPLTEELLIEVAPDGSVRKIKS